VGNFEASTALHCASPSSIFVGISMLLRNNPILSQERDGRPFCVILRTNESGIPTGPPVFRHHQLTAQKLQNSMFLKRPHTNC